MDFMPNREQIKKNRKLLNDCIETIIVNNEDDPHTTRLRHKSNRLFRLEKKADKVNQKARITFSKQYKLLVILQNKEDKQRKKLKPC